MTASVYLVDAELTPSVVLVECSSITISGTKNIDTTPDVNISTGPTEVQTQSFENLNYVISGVHFTGVSGTLTWDNVMTLYRKKYTGSNYTLLHVNYGTASILSGLSASTDIKVILKTPNLPIDASNSKQGYMPIGNLTFVETG